MSTGQVRRKVWARLTNDVQRYVYPLISPPTPERLEQDKKSIEEQFDKAFALVEQLAKDTEVLKDSEKQRTERLDSAISELQTVMADLKSANRRRENDAQQIRDEVQALKDAIPKAMENQKNLTNNRLSEINTELTSLKTLVSQRMAPIPSPAPPGSMYSRQTGGTLVASRSTTPNPAIVESPPSADDGNSAAPSSAASESPAQSSSTRPPATSNGTHATKASIPAWQLAASASQG